MIEILVLVLIVVCLASAFSMLWLLHLSNQMEEMQESIWAVLEHEEKKNG